MELRQIRYFVVLAEELHFGRAAKRIYIAQSALSQQIQKLEEELGSPLFTRNTHKVALTETGFVFLKHAKIILKEVRHAEDSVTQAAKGYSGKLTIGFVEAALWDIGPKLIRSFNQKYPKVELVPHQMNTLTQLEALKQQKLQIGIVGKKVPLLGVNYQLIREEAWLLALPSWHPLVNGKQAAFEDLAEERFIAIRRESGAFYFDQFIQTCMDNGFSPNIVLTADKMQPLLAFVASGMGIALIPESARNIRDDLCYVALKGVIKKRYKLFLAWQASEQSKVVENFVEEAVLIFPQLE